MDIINQDNNRIVLTDIKPSEVDRIAELEEQLRIRGERMELMREWLDGSDTYTMSGYDWPKLKSWFDDNGKAL